MSGVPPQSKPRAQEDTEEGPLAAKAAALRQTSLPVGLSYHLPTSGPLTPKQYRERLTCSVGTQHVFLPQSKWVPAHALLCAHPASLHWPVQVVPAHALLCTRPATLHWPVQGVQDCVPLWTHLTSLYVPLLSQPAWGNRLSQATCARGHASTALLWPGRQQPKAALDCASPAPLHWSCAGASSLHRIGLCGLLAWVLSCGPGLQQEVNK